MQNIKILENEKKSLAKVYFTPEILQAFNIESEAVLHYGVYEFLVKLYWCQDNIVSVMVNATGFFQKIFSSIDGSSLSVRLKSLGKTLVTGSESLLLEGAFSNLKQKNTVSVNPFSDEDENEFIEVVFILNEESYGKIKAVIGSIVRAAESYQSNVNVSLELTEDHLFKKLLLLRFSSLHLEQSEGTRILPKKFTERGMSFWVKKDLLEAGQEVDISLVVLQHKVHVEFLATVESRDQIYEHVEEIYVSFLQRPPIVYFLFLEELSLSA